MKPNSIDASLQSTLLRLNWHYGKGEIVDINEEERTVYRWMPFAGSDTRKYSISGNKVSFLGQRRTIGYKALD